jgi:chemosensory pili system protein ChpA (sensor histidine kinase/response regulator)
VEQVIAMRPGLGLAHARTGGEALALAAELTPELILLDLRLPDAGGAQIVAELRRDPATRSAHIVVLSGETGPAERDAALAAGADAFLAKPVLVQELLEALAAGLDRSAQPSA